MSSRPPKTTSPYIHVAVAVDDDLGAVLDHGSFPADLGRYVQLLDWAATWAGG